MARRRKIKESHMGNNAIIVLAIAGFAFFYWRENRLGGAAQNVRSPKTTLENFHKLYAQKRSNFMRDDVSRPPREIKTLEDILPTDGWEGLDFYILESDIEWLHKYANYISLGASKGLPEWQRLDPWERFVLARATMLRGAPWQSFSIVGEPEENDREGVGFMLIQSSDGQVPVKFLKVDRMWKIHGFFGAKDRWTSEFMAQVERLLPEEYHIKQSTEEWSDSRNEEGY